MCCGRKRPGTCAITIVGVVCGLRAASLPLDAQPVSEPQTGHESQASFDERFSSGDRIWPVFMHPDIQGVIASLPPSATPADSIVADTEAELPSAENTASLAAPAPPAETPALPPGPEMPLPEFPPPPDPAEVVLPSQEELATAPSQGPPPPSASPLAVSRAEDGRRAEAEKPSPSQPRAEKKRNLKTSRGQKTARARRPPAEQNHPATTGSLPACGAGAACVSPQQSFAILFGFLAGALLGGPVGAIAGGMLGAIMTAPDAGQSPRPGPTRP